MDEESSERPEWTANPYLAEMGNAWDAQPSADTSAPEQYPFTEHYANAAKSANFPMQPMCVRPDGEIQFVQNRIVRDLLDVASAHGLSLNDIATRRIGGLYTDAELMQLSQLIGYTINGYSELSYVTDESYAAAEHLAKELQK